MNLGATDAILLMAYGGPQSLADIPAFLADIRHGRPISEAFLTEVTERYRLIGGFSPLVATCERLRDKLAAALGTPVYVGMRHSSPFIQTALQQIAQDGYKNVTCVCLAPHYSSLSILEYQKLAMKANAQLETPLDLHFVNSWATQKDFIAFHVAQINQVKEKFGIEDCSQTQVLLTAHSLPARILQMGDPYVDELQLTVDAIARGLEGLGQPQLAFQSASPSPEPWLSPYVEETLKQLAAKGLKNIIISPIGFVAEHVEVLYDIDIVVQELAVSLGLNVKRAAMLNDRPEMVAILSAIVEESKWKVQKPFVVEPTEHFLA
jgi:ferrochelatase